MIATLLTILALSPAALAWDVPLAAAEAELERARTMALPGQPSPYFVNYEILDGEVATAGAVLGALDTFDHGPYRNLRVEVRVGDYGFDNANFDVSFGERDGTRVRGLPHEDVDVALRRELWMATDDAYKGAAEQFAAKQAAREGRTGEHTADLYAMDGLTTDPIPRPSADAAWARATVEGLTAGFAELDWIEEGGALARDWQGSRMLVTTEGTRAWVPTGFSVVRIEAITRAEDGAKLRNTRSWVARTPAELPTFDEMKAEVEDMTAWVDGLRDAPIEDDYLGPVLFEDAAAVELFRQLVVPEIVGTPPPERAPDPFSDNASTPPSARLGRRLLPEGWSIVDDPGADPAAAGAYTHDFQGVAGQRVEVVQDGVVRDLLMSRVPREGFSGSTGHGRALGADRRTAIPSVLSITPRRGKSDKKLRRKALQLARQAGLDYVLVIRRVEPPALSDDFHIAFSGEGPLPGLTRPAEAYRLYPDGREEPVRGLTFLGVDRRVLRDIAIAGAPSPGLGVMDSAPGPGRFSIGAIGGLPATWSVPPVVITELELRGAGGSDPRVIPAPPLAAQAIGSGPPE